MLLNADPPWELVRFVGAALLATTAAVIDFRWWKIPNWLTVSGLVVGLVVRGALEGTEGLVDGLTGFAFGFGLLFILFAIGGGGGGDVKLLAAEGVWLGFGGTVVAFIASAMVVAVIEVVAAVVRFLSNNPSTRVEGRFTTLTGRERRRRGVVPYAVPLSLAIWSMTLLHWVRHL